MCLEVILRREGICSMVEAHVLNGNLNLTFMAESLDSVELLCDRAEML